MEYYDALATGYHELHKNEQKNKLRLIKEHLNIKENDTLLDVGCGTGFSSEFFSCRITGLEPSRNMLKEAKKTERNAVFVQGRAENLPFSDATFDFVICVTSLHNFDSPKQALEEMRRVGKGSGAISILKKAAKAQELKTFVHDIFPIKELIEEDKDTILFFELGANFISEGAIPPKS